MTSPTPDELDAIDLDANHIADPTFWTAPAEHRHRVFAALRRREPVRWYPPRTSAFSRPCTGFWALTTYEDVWHASRAPSVFCSGLSIDIEETPDELGEFFPSMINLDDPQHHRLRRLVSAGFTPKRIALLDETLRTQAARILDRLLDRYGDGSEFDFVAEVAAQLPLHAIGEMVGVPATDQHLIYEWTNAVVSPDDPSVGIDGAAAGNRALADYALALGQDRLARPTDDLTSVLMHAEVDGERLSPWEFANFFILLVSAGNETTRNAISHGMRLLTLYPAQRRVWWEHFEQHAASAAEEIVRFETPISNMARVLTEEVEIRGVRLPAGSKVALWYPSANRDETVFPEPHRFDVTRTFTRPQASYGGGGPHFCLGANLARAEIRIMFDVIADRMPDIRPLGPPRTLRSMFINGIKEIPVSYT